MSLIKFILAVFMNLLISIHIICTGRSGLGVGTQPSGRRPRYKIQLSIHNCIFASTAMRPVLCFCLVGTTNT